MDIDGLRELLGALSVEEIGYHAVDTAEPSPFSYEILNANPYAFLDDAPLEERRARAVQLRRTLPGDAGEVGALDEAAIVEVARESAPVVRNADELHDALLTLCVVPPLLAWESWYGELQHDQRATTLMLADPTDGSAGSFWIATERARLAGTVYPTSRAISDPPNVGQPEPATLEDAAVAVLRGWLESSGPQTASELGDRLMLTPATVAAALARLEGEGQVLRGRFSAAGRAVGAETEWCNRRVLARIHRLTLGRLRREIEPVAAADFIRFLTRWQHLAAGTQLHGPDGVLQVVNQLQGYETAASVWERDVLPRRIVDYAPAMLDELCLAGDVMWGRLSPHPAFATESAHASESAEDEPVTWETPTVRRVRPTRVAPLTILLREDADWLLGESGGDHRPEALSHPAREVLAQLHAGGASFLRDLVRATGRLPSEVEDGLWELVTAGLVTADGFDSLRSLIDPKRRRGEGRHRRLRPRHSTGRWALLRRAGLGNRSRAEKPGSETERFARQLLARWGVVFRDLIVRETAVPGWRDLLVSLRRLEARGEIRGGRFVDGFLGEQFVLPEALDALRIIRRTSPRGGDALLMVSAANPLNLAGIVTPGPRISVLSGEMVRVIGRDEITIRHATPVSPPQQA